MRTKMFTLLTVLFMAAMGVQAEITLQDPVITDSYMKFVGENATNNYRFTLDTYEWADRGPQFQLTIEPIDASKPAQFTTSDLSDPNYWEPLFRYYTEQLAGEAMEAKDNVKRLYVKNVALLTNQFADYENFHIIGIEAAGDYTIPDGCFSGCSKLDEFDCNVAGTTTLGTNIVAPQSDFTVKVYTQQASSSWQSYKESNDAHFVIDSSNVPAPEPDPGTSAITLLDPVITDSYMKFVGENATNNYRFTLDTYEWADRGPQFQLTIEPIDASKPAQFTTSDLSDPNYWEPLFRYYTEQLAGEAMEAKDNVKRLYVKDVALLTNQFADYENFHIIGIEAAGDYTIPDGCFSGCSKLDEFDCNVAGTTTLGTNIVDPQSDFTVKVYTQQASDTWQSYKESNDAHFVIDSSNVPEPEPDPDEIQVLSVSINATGNGLTNNIELPNKSQTIPFDIAIVSFLLNGFTAQTSGNVTELFMDYDIYPTGDGGMQHEWKQIHATDQGNGTWSYDGPAVNVLADLQSNTAYTLEFSFSTNPANESTERAHYPTNGEHMQILFQTGTILTGIDDLRINSVTPGPLYNLNGQRVDNGYKGIVIQNGKKAIIK